MLINVMVTDLQRMYDFCPLGEGSLDSYRFRGAQNAERFSLLLWSLKATQPGHGPSRELCHCHGFLCG